MKRLLLIILLGVVGGASIYAQKAENPEGKIADKPTEESPTTGDKLLPTKDFNNPGLEYLQLSADDGTTSDIVISKNLTLDAPPTNNLTRLELPRVQITGSVTPVIKKRTFGSFLQLFNPFAPAEYGGSEEPFAVKSESRAFHDPVTDKPSTVLIGVGGKPKKVDPD